MFYFLPTTMSNEQWEAELLYYKIYEIAFFLPYNLITQLWQFHRLFRETWKCSKGIKNYYSHRGLLNTSLRCCSDEMIQWREWWGEEKCIFYTCHFLKNPNANFSESVSLISRCREKYIIGWIELVPHDYIFKWSDSVLKIIIRIICIHWH